MSASHFFDETGQLGEVLLPVHEFAAGVPSARDRSRLHLHFPGIVRIDPHYAGVVLFSVRCGMVGAVEVATLYGRGLGLSRVEWWGGCLPLHVGADAYDGYISELDVAGLHRNWFF